MGCCAPAGTTGSACVASVCVPQAGQAVHVTALPPTTLVYRPRVGRSAGGRGICVCGTCMCDQDDKGGFYGGSYCNKCSTCPNRCKEFKECVQCLVFKTGSITPEECIANCTFELTVMDVVE
ncbi:integrin beta-PS-like, partial [Homalodisca vitripennis]|uniref:integrin beta-PS-like n=1 Tax=Homalodisca vitripennis TaxID=197043 RepID=UPI001EEACF16